MDTNATQPAFPAQHGLNNLPGMTKREYFVAQALLGILSGRRSSIVKFNSRDVAELACEIADAALKEISRGH